MMQRKNNFLQNKSNIGTWITIPSPDLVDVICKTELDFLVIDYEHSPISLESVQIMVSVCEANNVTPILRVQEIERTLIQKSLETGIHGIQIANINNVQDIKKFKNFSNYHPIGVRGLSPFTKACSYTKIKTDSYTKSCNEQLIRVVQVEGREAVENINGIAENQDYDICFIGLYDLSNSLGCPGKINDKVVKKVFEEIVSILKSYNVKVGSISNSMEQLKYLKGLGIDYITHSADCAMAFSCYREIVSSFRGGID